MAASRRRRRVILWSLLVGFLVGLGLMLNAWLPPQPRCVIRGGGSEIHFVSNDGGTIFTSWPIQRPPFQTWDTHSGQNLGIFLADLDIASFSMSPDGRFWATADIKNRDLYLVDLKQEWEPKKILANYSDFPWVTFSSQGSFLVTRGEKNRATGHLVECSTGRVAKSFQKLTFFRFLPNENTLFVEDGKLELWDARNGKAVRRFKDISPIELSADGTTLLAQSVDHGMFLLMDMGTQKTRLLKPHLFSAFRIQAAFSPDGKTLITCPASEIAVWDVASGKQRYAEKRPDGNPGNVLFSPDSTLFLEGGTLRDSATGHSLWKRDIRGWDFGTFFSLDCQYLFCRYVPPRSWGEYYFEIIDVKTGETRKTIRDNIFGPEPSKDGSFYSVLERANQGPSFLQKLFGDWWPWKNNADDWKVTVFETATGRIVGQLQGKYGIGHLSNDGRTMVTSYCEPDGTLSLRCWDLPLRPPLRLVVGIPLGIGLFFVLISWWRGRRRTKSLPA